MVEVMAFKALVFQMERRYDRKILIANRGEIAVRIIRRAERWESVPLQYIQSADRMLCIHSLRMKQYV